MPEAKSKPIKSLRENTYSKLSVLFFLIRTLPSHPKDSTPFISSRLSAELHQSKKKTSYTKNCVNLLGKTGQTNVLEKRKSEKKIAPHNENTILQLNSLLSVTDDAGVGPKLITEKRRQLAINKGWQSDKIKWERYTQGEQRRRWIFSYNKSWLCKHKFTFLMIIFIRKYYT